MKMRKKRKALAIFLLCLFLFALAPKRGLAAEPQVQAGAALLIWRERRHKGSLWKQGVVALLALALLGWLAWFTLTGQTKVPLLRTGFRMVVFSVIIMIVVLFFRRGLMGDKELFDLFRARRKKKEAAK